VNLRIEKEDINMSNLEKAKQIIEQNLRYARNGIWDYHNICGDYMTTLYSGDSLIVLICYARHYFEVFGLSKTEFIELKAYYDELNND
jgi:hypothetical protein